MALNSGVRLPVGMADVFPYGCHLVPGSITEAQLRELALQETDQIIRNRLLGIAEQYEDRAERLDPQA